MLIFLLFLFISYFFKIHKKFTINFNVFAIYYDNNFSIIASLSILKYFNNSSAFPDFPNVSSIPILSTFTGYDSDKTSHILLPKPPITLWSSTVIILFVSFAHFIISSLSIGLIVKISTTRTLMFCLASSSFAFSASDTATPVAKIVASIPFPCLIPFPISNFYFLSYIIGVASLASLTYTDDFIFDISSITHLVCVSSEGLITIILGSVLIKLRSSSI